MCIIILCIHFFLYWYFPTFFRFSFLPSFIIFLLFSFKPFLFFIFYSFFIQPKPHNSIYYLFPKHSDFLSFLSSTQMKIQLTRHLYKITCFFSAPNILFVFVNPVLHASLPHLNYIPLIPPSHLFAPIFVYR